MSEVLQIVRNVFCLVLCLLLSFPSFSASPTRDLVQAFVSAYEVVKQPKINKEDLDHYFSYMADNITDYHAAYGVTINGKDKKREGILKKSQDMVSFKIAIESITIGSETAMVVVNEDSKYYKDGELKQFKGRTIVVSEFDEKGLIQHMRRYLD